MSASEEHKNNVPAALGGDLPETEQVAVEEGHDADIPSSKGVEKTQSQQDAAAKATTIEPEKSNTDRPSTASSSSPSSKEASGQQDVEKGAADATAEEAEAPRDPNIVDWEGPDDPENPYNWPASKKWSNIAILSLLTLLIPLASSMFAPGVPDVMEEFETTKYETPIPIPLLNFTKTAS